MNQMQGLINDNSYERDMLQEAELSDHLEGTAPDCVVSEMFLSLSFPKSSSGSDPQDITHRSISRWFSLNRAPIRKIEDREQNTNL